jgi:hypothetical protein
VSTLTRRSVAMLATLLLLAACGTAPSLDRGPAGVPAAPGASDAPDTIELTDPTEGLTEVTWLATFDPFREADLAWSDADEWPALFAALPRQVTADPLDVTMRLVRDPDVCTLWHRIPSAVDMGPGDAEARMAATVLTVLDTADHAPAPLLGPGDASWCEDRTRDSLAFLASDVSPAFCADAAGGSVRCVTVTTFRYDGGAHANTVHTDLVFDTTTGATLDADELLATYGTDVMTARAHVEDLVCELDRAEGMLGPHDACWDVQLRNLRPTATGMLFSFSPYESGPYVVGARDLFVPADVLAAGPLLTPAVRATQRALTDAVRAADWDAIRSLLPADGRFTAGFDAPADPIAYYRALERDPLEEWLTALTQPPGRVAELTVWPQLHARDPFTISDEERPRLAAAFGEDSLLGWEAAGAYLGWRAGFDADGTWRFMVAGD